MRAWRGRLVRSQLGRGPRALRGLALLAGLAGPAGVIAQAAAPVPFAVGERFTYAVRASRMGTIGRGTMSVEGPIYVRGVSALVLRFEIKAGVGPFHAEDRTTSLLDVQRMASLRFTKHERHPFSSHDESVEIFPEARRWQAADGDSGVSPTDAPLDELSFIYFLRTLPLADDSVYLFSRHFDAVRSPTRVRVTGRESIETRAGAFRTLVVEMYVRDPGRYEGEGLIRINLSDDDARIPVRIESTMRGIGTTVLTLESRTPGAEPRAAARR